MFDTPAEAHQIIEERFSKDQVEMLLKGLGSVITFSVGGSDARGSTRIGGTPDLPRGMDWPRRPIPQNIDEIAKRSGEPYDKELRDHLAGGLPYAFVAQVDLKEASSMEGAAAILPSEGRLLFFYDMIAGPFDTGTQSARVIWDQSPADGLAPAAEPDALAQAAAAWRKSVDDANKQYNLKPQPRGPGAAEPGTPYGGPARPMTLKSSLQLPPPMALEFEATGQLAKTYFADRSVIGGAQAFSQAYSELSGEYDPVNQLLGLPAPVQDDPRYDAVVVSEFNKQSLTGDDWTKNKAEIFRKAADWRLLLQIDVSDLMQESGEGTVYFLIRGDDLEKRNFDRVVAVYQQT
ncbi:DUF1963 domain-containing protein [Rhizobium sp. P38BS-XIX]|uniref:DUF1963 domain-containing protein n=1 Tax=Rhizobium sp. P38BS-XIX TaxID=2726740 RepID=UPI00145757EF|nr:DUF1963 domain-containing protein [Rhizobium sp. P38BS-XIX]NLS00770.1 DUF1963 domain-containing protein [Rhizobium sp. P38BS-XIX]